MTAIHNSTRLYRGSGAMLWHSTSYNNNESTSTSNLFLEQEPILAQNNLFLPTKPTSTDLHWGGRMHGFLCGEHACQYEHSLCGTKYSILPALSLDSILHIEVVEKVITGDNFRWFVQGLLLCMNEWPLPNSILVIDNASIHKVAGIHEMVEECGTHLLYLPAYLPHFNPIKLAFSTIKMWLCTNCDHVNQELEAGHGTVYNIFWEAVYLVTAEHTKGWYSHCGYNVPIWIYRVYHFVQTARAMFTMMLLHMKGNDMESWFSLSSRILLAYPNNVTDDTHSVE